GRGAPDARRESGGAPLCRPRRDARARGRDGEGSRGARTGSRGGHARHAGRDRPPRGTGTRRRGGSGDARRAHRRCRGPHGGGRAAARDLPGRRPGAAQGLARSHSRGGAGASDRRDGGLMLYEVLYDLRTYWAPLHVFRYITFRTLIAGLAAMTLSLVLGPLVIRQLASLQIGPSIREDGPAAHMSKRGTPTMGGMLILFPLALATLLLADPGEPYVWIALGVTLSHGLIGFFDDWAKVRKRNSRGVPGRLRL